MIFLSKLRRPFLRTSFLFGGIFLAAFGAAARENQEILCKRGSQSRKVEILYSAPPALVPCSVKYAKRGLAEDKGSLQWSAQNHEGFCEQKAAEYISQLSEKGWSCQHVDATH